MSTAKAWAERRRVIDGLPHYTRKQLEDLYEQQKVSLGIVRPTEILDLKIEEAEKIGNRSGRAS